MAAPNQSPMSSKAFPLSPGDSGMSLSSHQKGRVAWPRTAVMMAAWLEIIVGASFLIATDAQSQFLFGATAEGLAVIFAQFVGIALISLGIACVPSKVAGTRQMAVRGLLIYNITIAIFFAWVAVATMFRGVLLWPVVIMHTVIAITLFLVLRKEAY